MTIITEYPIWFVAFCLLLGGTYSALLYWKDKSIQEMGIGLRRFLATLRFLLVSFLAFLLLGPLMKIIFRQVEKPIIVIAQDNSESVIIGRDSISIQGYKNNLDDLISSLSTNYEVQTYSFGENTSEGIDYEFNEKRTDLSAFFADFITLYSNRNVGAVIFASDGIYNRGINPLYSQDASKIDVPIYTIALGDTSVKRDIVVEKVAHNRLAYLGNKFPLEVMMKAKQCGGESVQLDVTRNGKKVHFEKIEIKGTSYLNTIPIQIEAKETGIQHYRISISTVENEVSNVNNVKDIYIDVLDSRQKIILLGNSPHPDIGALREAIASNENYEVEVELISSIAQNKEFESYNLVILHQLPAKGKKGAVILKSILGSSVPVLFILGPQSDIATFNSYKAGLSISGSKNKINEVQPVHNDQFSLFTLGEDISAGINDWPPLSAPFGNYKAAVGTEVLLNQKIGMVVTKLPMVIFSGNTENKRAIITGEGIWKWRLHNYSVSNSHKNFNKLIGKMVQFLSLKVDKSQFKVFGENNFFENEPIKLEAEVYNESYELVAEAEITLSIINDEGKKFSFSFNWDGKSYFLDAGSFPVGEYQYEAQVRLGEKIFQEKGEFSVSPIQIEGVQTIANHQLLNNLSANSGGEMVLAPDLGMLQQIISSRDDIRSVSHTEKHLKELINLQWIFFILLGLLSLEWFLRKRNGAY